MDKIRNLSIRKTIVLYMAVTLVICFFLSVLLMQAAGEIQSEIWWKYVDKETYYEFSKNDERYLRDVPRPHQSEMSRMDNHITEVCDFLQTFSVLIVSVAGSVIAVFLFYSHKLKLPIAELELASKKIGENDLDFHITYTNRDEMGMLCRKFEQMRKQLAQNNRKLWKTIEEEKALRAAIAHDIRSPLSVLEGYQEMLMDYLPNEGIEIGQAMKMVEESQKQIARMDAFVEMMRKLSSLESRRLTAKEMTGRELISDLQAELSILEKKSGKNCCLQWEETQARFVGDKEVMLEVAENLLSNALRCAREKVEVSVTMTDLEVRIRVRDDGFGFGEDIENVTKPFYQKNVKDSLKHAGMGMYLSRLYCEKHGGRLLLENEERGGAVITAVFYAIGKTLSR